MEKNREKIMDALETLSKEGEKAFVPEYVDKQTLWSKVGMAISSQFVFSDKMWDLIYNVAEDWNFHDVCAMIDFVFRNKESSHIFETLQVVIPHYLNKEVECKSYDSFGHFTTKKIKVTVNIEEIK
jgi:hypothetical protein